MNQKKKRGKSGGFQNEPKKSEEKAVNLKINQKKACKKSGVSN